MSEKTKFDGRFIINNSIDLTEKAEVLDTSIIPENENLYWTEERFNSTLAEKTTDDLSQGINNKYFADGLAQDAVGSALVNTDSINFNYSGNEISAEVQFGTGAGKACEGNDERLSNVRSPVGTALTSAYIWIGSAGNLATAVSISGEISITNIGNVTVSNSAVIGKVLTGFSASAGTVSATDSIIQAFNKIVGNIALKLTANSAITGETKTKITYDSNGLVTSGSDATTDDISEGLTNKYFSNALAIAATLTSYVAGAGIITSSDSILSAIQKLSGNITAAISTANSYADSIVVGLWDDRGTHDASGNTFPTSGGSGTAGAILKGDIWTISVAGTLGGNAVNIGDTVRALVDTPGSTSSNWAISENNIGYVPENQANKSTDLDTDKASNTKYSTPKSIYDWAVALFVTVSKVVIATGKVLTVNNTLTFSGTDSSSVDFGGGGTNAYTDKTQAFSKQQTLTPTTLTSSSGSIAWDANNGNFGVHTMSENTTLANPTNLVTGGVYTFQLTQISPAKTLAFGNKWKFVGGTPTITTTNGAVQYFSGIYDGTNINCGSLVGPFS